MYFSLDFFTFLAFPKHLFNPRRANGSFDFVSKRQNLFRRRIPFFDLIGRFQHSFLICAQYCFLSIIYYQCFSFQSHCFHCDQFDYKVASEKELKAHKRRKNGQLQDSFLRPWMLLNIASSAFPFSASPKSITFRDFEIY